MGATSLRNPRRSLRFLAGTCVFTGWLTLVLSLLGGGISLFMGIGMLASGLPGSNSTNYFPTPPSSGGGIMGGDGSGMPTMPGSGGAGGLMGELGAALFGKVIAAFTIGGALFTMVSGVVTFVLFLGLAQACYALIDIETQQHRMNDTLGILLARLGSR